MDYVYLITFFGLVILGLRYLEKLSSKTRDEMLKELEEAEQEENA